MAAAAAETENTAQVGEPCTSGCRVSRRTSRARGSPALSHARWEAHAAALPVYPWPSPLQSSVPPPHPQVQDWRNEKGEIRRLVQGEKRKEAIMNTNERIYLQSIFLYSCEAPNAFFKRIIQNTCITTFRITINKGNHVSLYSKLTPSQSHKLVDIIVAASMTPVHQPRTETGQC